MDVIIETEITNLTKEEMMPPLDLNDAPKMEEKSKNLTRARQSLIEELDAINLYQERIEATRDERLKKVLEHNRDEEKEHATMLIEYLKENDPTFKRMFEEDN